METSKKYAKGEKVLCTSEGGYYEAKILDVGIVDDDGSAKYFIHYQGWKRRWDEWVTVDRMLEYSDENLQKCQNDIRKIVRGKADGRRSASQGSNASRSSSIGESSKAESVSTMSGVGGGLRKRIRGGKAEKQIKSKKHNVGENVDSGSTADSQDNGGGNISETSAIGEQKVESSDEPTALDELINSVAAGKGVVGKLEPDDIVQSAGDGNVPETSTKPKKRQRRQPAPAKDEPPPQKIDVPMPDELKQILVDDYKLVTCEKKLCKPPASRTVDAILENYVQDLAARIHKKESSKESQVSKTAAAGVREYFNEMCGIHLLYKFEKLNYQNILAKEQAENSSGEEKTDPETPEMAASGTNRRPRLSSYYGYPHLLRLFVRFGKFLAHGDLDDEVSGSRERGINAILKWVSDFMRYLIETKDTYFNLDDYEVASVEYIREAENAA